MKRIFIFSLLIATLAMPAGATTMCAADDVISVVLDPLIDGTDFRSNSELFEWSATFPYGTVFGIATCVGTPGTLNFAANGDLIDTATGDVATGGERTGQYCWCQMTHPMESRWVFRYACSSDAACWSNCASFCGNIVRDASAYRGGVFGSVGD